MSISQKPCSESEPYARRDELARLAGEVKTMKACVNGRANAESATIDGEIKSLAAEHNSEFRVVLEAIKTLGHMELKMKALYAEMKAMKDKIILEIEFAKERPRSEIRLLKWEICLILAFAVPTFVRVFSSQKNALLFGG